MQHNSLEPGSECIEAGPSATPQSRSRSRIFSKRKRLAALAVGAAFLVVAQPLPAEAASKSFGDCTLSAWLEVVKTYTVYGKQMDVRAVGKAPCANRHAWTSATIQLKRAFSVTRTASTTFYNSYGLGGHQLRTAPDSRNSGCDYYQAVLTVNISGLGSSYVTSGSPVWLCI